MDIVDKIATETPVTDSNGTVKPGSKPIIETITVKKFKDTDKTEKEETPYVCEYTPTESDVLHHAVITVKDLGEIKVTLNETVAPITVNNFITLANSGFYDGLTFHRIMNGFMIQGGDPNGDGTGGSDTEIKGEFSANGVQNDIPHVKGVISMARNSYSMDSASSQFFIMHKTATHLDGQYAAFGFVTEGIEIVDTIATNTPVTDSNGTVLAENQPIIESIKIID
ncbi:MAG: peptidylprolyl isomerase [Clostridia bacterium]|nr:peptidylprolyl isomerase [Clostridia bacterium]MBP3706820.1 peptidylprolyl isomerase [Clostridia bacterium]